MIQKGRIIKNYNGYYYVETADKTLFTCKVKGKLKQERLVLLPETLWKWKPVVRKV